MRKDGRTDIHDGANSRFLRFLRTRQKNCVVSWPWPVTTITPFRIVCCVTDRVELHTSTVVVITAMLRACSFVHQRRCVFLAIEGNGWKNAVWWLLLRRCHCTTLSQSVRPFTGSPSCVFKMPSSSFASSSSSSSSSSWLFTFLNPVSVYLLTVGVVLFLHLFTHTHTLGRTPLHEWSARRKDRYLYKNTPSIQAAGFEPAVPASELPQT